MKISKRLLAFLFAAASICGGARADTMYKCTDAKGKLTFTDQPCAGTSKSSTLDVPAPRSAAAAGVAYQDDSEAARLKRANEAFNQRAAERDRIAAAEEKQAAEARAARQQQEEYVRAEKLRKEREEAHQEMLRGIAIRREIEERRWRGY